MKTSLLGIALAAAMPLMYAQSTPANPPASGTAATTAPKTHKHSKKPVKKPAVKKSADTAKPAAAAK